MTQFVEFPLADGGTVTVAVDESEAGIVPVATPEEVAGKATQTFENALDHVRPVASAFIDKVRALHDPPDRVEVMFGLTMSVDAGAIIAKTGVGANFKVTLTWSRESSDRES